MKPITRITPATRWRGPDVGELWRYRELFVALGMRDVKVRYRQTILGVAWALLQPLATILLFTIIFGRFAGIPSDGYPYAAFVYAGLLPWSLFSSTVTTASGSILGSSSFVTRVWFPRILIPPASVASPLVDFTISALLLLVLLPFFGVGWRLELLALPLLTALLVLLAISVGTIFSAVIVTWRDVRFVLAFLMQFWLFASPVIYPVTIIPERYRWLLMFNPMTGIIEGFRWSFLGKPFDPVALAVAVVMTGILAVIAVIYFQRVEEQFADVI